MVGDCCHIFRLLQRLECPDTLDKVKLHLLECAVEMASEFLGQYLQDRIRRDDRFRGRLGVAVSCGTYASSFDISARSFDISAFGKINIPTMRPGQGYPHVSLSTGSTARIPQGACEKLCADLIALTPRERVVSFTGVLGSRATRDILITMPNIENLYLPGSVDFDMFLQPDPLSHTKFLPSLRRLCLHSFTVRNYNDWKPLIGYLAHQMSGDQAISLWVCGEYSPIPPEAMKEMKALVKEFNFGYPNVDEWY